jgi:hypothetical protein
MGKRILYFFGLLILFILAFIIGGWDLIIGAKKSLLTILLEGDSGLIWTSDTLAVRFNDKYYGFLNTHRFFNAPFIAWILLMFSLISLYYSLKILFFGDESIEEDFDLSKEVRSSIEETWEKEGITNIKIESLVVTNKAGNEYVGILETTVEGELHKDDVQVLYDGENLQWKILSEED